MKYSIYDLKTGLFTGFVISAEPHHLDQNVPDGCSVIMGEYDHCSQRVDLTDHSVVAYRPPAPAADQTKTWEWSDETQRWVAVPTLAAIAQSARRQRDATLAACDWTQVSDSPLSLETRDAWKDYRVRLRNVCQQPGFPTSIDWPVPPT